jgi:hypothetical protein
MTLEELRTKLNEALIQAHHNIQDRRMHTNSYGSGYDKGWRDALITVLNTVNGEHEDIL